MRPTSQPSPLHKHISRLLSRKPTTRANAILDLSHYSNLRHNKTVRTWISRYMQKHYGVYLSSRCIYGPGLRLKHPTGIVIGSGVKIGDNVTIFQNVTIGGRRMGDGHSIKYPSIGDGSVIFSGAAILGDVKIGRHCVVGANAVVLEDIPDGCTAVGVPAKVIQTKRRSSSESTPHG